MANGKINSTRHPPPPTHTLSKEFNFSYPSKKEPLMRQYAPALSNKSITRGYESGLLKVPLKLSHLIESRRSLRAKLRDALLNPVAAVRRARHFI
jgi:hypothetical protein